MSARLVLRPVLLRLAVAGLLSGAAGFFGGAFLGYQLERSRFGWSCNCDDPGLLGLLSGIALGPLLLTPFSVYLANKRQGRLSVSLAESVGITAVAIAVLYLGARVKLVSPVGEVFWVFLFSAYPVAQAICAVLILACTSKRQHLA